MTEHTAIILSNWVHQIAAVTQELCMVHKMPFHADSIQACTRELHDALMAEAVAAEKATPE